MTIGTQTELQRALDLEIRITGTCVDLIGPQGRCSGTAHTLAILDVFATPKTLGEGLELLGTRAEGAHDWVSLTTEVMLLCERGFLVSPRQLPIQLPSHPDRFIAADVHVRMLEDHVRTSAFQRALFQHVSPQDVVLDIGTGTGVLAATAALAGAKHVYAVERSGNFSKLAREFFVRNELADKITLIEGESHRIRLPEQATILVSEIIGNDPLNEGLLPTLADARKRLLKPGGRVIPQRLKIHAQPLSIPDGKRHRVVFTEAAAKRWKEAYKLDFSVYAEFCAPKTFHTNTATSEVRDWPRLSEPVLVADLDLQEVAASPAPESRTTLRITRDGLLNAVVIFFTAELGDGVTLSVHPDVASERNSWASHIWVPGTPITVQSGSVLELGYRWDATMNRSEIVFHGSEARR